MRCQRALAIREAIETNLTAAPVRGGTNSPQPIARRRISFALLGKEPFRIFFPIGVLAGIIGVALWPMHFNGVTEFYPGVAHARIMGYGLFGGFIVGFLGTAMPRLLSVKPLGTFLVLALVLLHLGMVGCFVLSKIFVGDLLFVTLLAIFLISLVRRLPQRKDIPPPGFVLVGLAFLCAGAGAVLSIVQYTRETDFYTVTLQRLLSYQGFVLLPILGIGPFLLPRFFGMPSRHNFAESAKPPPGWWKKALLALGAGLLILGSFFLEAAGFFRTGHALRFGTVLIYLIVEMPFHLAPEMRNTLGASIRIAFVLVLAGFLAVAIFPEYRVALLHLTLIGGFAVITFTVATRVVFGHSGNIERLKARNRWFVAAMALMIVGMATRISGDLWPRVLTSHYGYGGLLWIAGVLLWASYVLPSVLVADREEE